MSEIVRRLRERAEHLAEEDSKCGWGNDPSGYLEAIAASHIEKLEARVGELEVALRDLEKTSGTFIGIGALASALDRARSLLPTTKRDKP